MALLYDFQTGNGVGVNDGVLARLSPIHSTIPKGVSMKIDTKKPTRERDIRCNHGISHSDINVGTSCFQCKKPIDNSSENFCKICERSFCETCYHGINHACCTMCNSSDFSSDDCVYCYQCHMLICKECSKLFFDKYMLPLCLYCKAKIQY